MNNEVVDVPREESGLFGTILNELKDLKDEEVNLRGINFILLQGIKGRRSWKEESFRYNNICNPFPFPSQWMNSN